MLERDVRAAGAVEQAHAVAQEDRGDEDEDLVEQSGLQALLGDVGAQDADWIIDLGPGAGHDGGRVVFEGTPADLVADRST